MSDHGNWRRPSKCANPECVEVSQLPDGKVMIRTSLTPMGTLGTALATAEEWAAFRDAVKAGEYDDLTEQR